MCHSRGSVHHAAAGRYDGTPYVYTPADGAFHVQKGLFVHTVGNLLQGGAVMGFYQMITVHVCPVHVPGQRRAYGAFAATGHADEDNAPVLF
jgi:hypothetical protein